MTQSQPDLPEGVDPSVPPSGPGCVECTASGGWWVHLRRCAQCGHIGCCDSSPSQHASGHYRETGHPVSASYEPGEDWRWHFPSQSFVKAGRDIALAAPTSHPVDQPAPGPAGLIPHNWRELING